MGTKVLQLVQLHVFKVLPFGSLMEYSITDVCIGIYITGIYYLYFRTSIAHLLCLIKRMHVSYDVRLLLVRCYTVSYVPTTMDGRVFSHIMIMLSCHV